MRTSGKALPVIGQRFSIHGSQAVSAQRSSKLIQPLRQLKTIEQSEKEYSVSNSLKLDFGTRSVIHNPKLEPKERLLLVLEESAEFKPNPSQTTTELSARSADFQCTNNASNSFELNTQILFKQTANDLLTNKYALKPEERSSLNHLSVSMQELLDVMNGI